MGESDFATKLDGYWGGTEEVAKADELIAALGLPHRGSPVETREGRYKEALESIRRCGPGEGLYTAIKLAADALDGSPVEPTPVTNTTSEAAKVPGATARFTPPYSVDNGDSKSVATRGSAQGPERCECGHSDVSHFIGSTDIKGPCGICSCMAWR